MAMLGHGMQHEREMRLLVGDSEVIRAREVTAIARDFQQRGLPAGLRLVWISIEVRAGLTPFDTSPRWGGSPVGGLVARRPAFGHLSKQMWAMGRGLRVHAI